MVKLLVLIVMVGCGGDYRRIEGQDEAEELVWNIMFDEGGCHPPPNVEWIPKNNRVLDVGAIAVDGLTLIGWKVQVLVHMDDERNITSTTPIANSEFAHELMHYHTWLHTGDVDPFHFRGDWELVKKAKFELAARGL